MKKVFAVFTALCLTCVLTASAEANYTTTLDIFGGVMMDFEEGVGFPEDSTPDVGTQSWGDTPAPILSQINSETPYMAIAALGYDVDYNIPDWDENYDWVLGVDLWMDGTTYNYRPDVREALQVSEVSLNEDDFSFNFSDTIGLGNFALADSGVTQAEIIGFLSGIPMDGYDEDIGGYYIDGDLQSGTIYLALEQDVNIPTGLIDAVEDEFGEINWDAMQAEFGGTITLTALSDEEPVVPEPGTLALLGSGLIGLFGYRKKRS